MPTWWARAAWGALRQPPSWPNGAGAATYPISSSATEACSPRRGPPIPRSRFRRWRHARRHGFAVGDEAQASANKQRIAYRFATADWLAMVGLRFIEPASVESRAPQS